MILLKIYKKELILQWCLFWESNLSIQSFWIKVDAIFERVYISNIASLNECWNLFWESNLYTESSVLLRSLRKSILENFCKLCFTVIFIKRFWTSTFLKRIDLNGFISVLVIINLFVNLLTCFTMNSMKITWISVFLVYSLNFIKLRWTTAFLYKPWFEFLIFYKLLWKVVFQIKFFKNNG